MYTIAHVPRDANASKTPKVLLQNSTFSAGIKIQYVECRGHDTALQGPSLVWISTLEESKITSR